MPGHRATVVRRLTELCVGITVIAIVRVVPERQACQVLVQAQ